MLHPASPFTPFGAQMIQPQPLPPGVVDSFRGQVELSQPPPHPWTPVVASLLTLVSLKEVAATLPEGDLRQDIVAQATEEIGRIIDDICGTPAHLFPVQPIPLPHGALVSLVAALAATAHAVQEGSLRRELLHLGGRILQQAATRGR